MRTVRENEGQGAQVGVRGLVRGAWGGALGGAGERERARVTQSPGSTKARAIQRERGPEHESMTQSWRVHERE